jgi:hypothetical protein
MMGNITSDEGTNRITGGVEALNELLCRDEQETEESQTRPSELLEAEAGSISSPTLARLIEEVRNEEANSAHAYNRMHNRHNRSR